MVEFAAALPVFLLLLLALVDFTRLMFTYISLADATREMARAAAISRNGNAPVIAAFNNYALIGGSTNPATDQVQVIVADQSCVTDLRNGQTCASTSLSSATCSLPLQSGCALPSRQSAGGGYVEVDLTYRFTFNPLFQSGVDNVSFMQQFTVVTTGERAYLE